MTPEQRLWLSAITILEQQVATASFNGFISDLSPVSIKGKSIILETPNQFNKLTLKDRYTTVISAALKACSGKDYDVIFIVPEEKSDYIEVTDEIPAITLNQKYTFDTFVIGSSNRFAHAAAKAVAKNPAKNYNPLFIYGGVGLGKTHLMHAIGNEIHLNYPSSHIMYVTSEKFTNELIAAIRNDKNEEFRAKYRNVDVLMIDDIQFISNKEGTQEEFFHTFNALHDTQKQIVISSDKQPKEIPTLEERLRSRFEWGLIADIQQPDLETRVAILEKKAIIDNLDVKSDVLHFIAQRVESNIRELEGSLTRVIAYADLTSQPISVKSASEALKDFYPHEIKREINVELIKQVVGDYYKINMDDFDSKKRNREISFPRQIAMYLSRELTQLSLPKVGDSFGGRDHTTVMHACDKINQDMNNDARLRTSIEDIVKRIKE